jgi:hypothetical protein
MTLLFAVFTITLYLIGVFCQRFYLKKPSYALRKSAFFLGLSAIACHGGFLAFFIYHQNLTAAALISVSLFFITLVTHLFSYRKSGMQNLMLITFPIASLSILLIILREN